MANDDDIFSNLNDGDRTVVGGNIPPANSTIIKPTPGGRRQSNAPPPGQGLGINNPAGNSALPQRPMANMHNVLEKTENNAVLAVAKPLLSLLTRLSQTHQHNDVNGLHERTLQEIRNFDANAQQKGINSQQSMIGRYILCAAIDETVLNTPWGSNSIWPNKSMLSTFHRENTGGQKFFTLMERMQQNPGQNIDLLEMIAICLSLGFQGKYRVVQGGPGHIETIRTQLHQQIAMIRGEYERDLSSKVAGIRINKSVVRNIPLWVVGAITGAIVISTYIGFSIALNNEAAPVLEKLELINPIKNTEDTKKQTTDE